jgi:thymidine kinase
MGRIEVICGGMFSGKTEELIRRLRRSQIARQRVQIFKPKLDDRFAEKQVVSHSSLRIHAQPVDKALEILDLIADNTRVVGIDEAQFFDEDVVQVSQKLSDRGLRVVAAGLDLDYRGLPFGSMPVLMAIAEEVTKVQAICAVCGMGASRSQRMVKDDDQVLVGAAEAYEPRCRLHHEPHVSDQMKQDLAGITDHSFIQNDQQILDDV